MPSHWAEDYIARFEGPTAVVRACKVRGCGFRLVRRKPAPGRAPLGRGSGMSAGNKQRGEMIQHIKTAHPELAPKLEA